MAEKLFNNLNIRSLTIGAPTGLKTKSLIPVLLHLVRKTLQPPAFNKLIQKREKNRQTRIMEPPVILLWPQSMNSPAIRTSVAFYPNSLNKTLKISAHIPVSPEPTPLTSRALRRPRPTKIFAFLNQPLYISQCSIHSSGLWKCFTFSNVYYIFFLKRR